MKKHYIKAVVGLLREGVGIDVVLTNLASTLKRKGHEKLHVPILQGVSKEFARTELSNTPRVTVAKQSDVALLQQAIEQALQKLGAKSNDMQVAIDTTLIGGFTASHKGTVINASYKDKLVSLYRNITK